MYDWNQAKHERFENNLFNWSEKDLSLDQFILQIKNVIVYYFWRPSHGIILGRKVCTKIDGFNPPSRLSSNKQTMGPVVAIVELLYEQSLGQSNGETERVFNNVPDPNWNLLWGNFVISKKWTIKTKNFVICAKSQR